MQSAFTFFAATRFVDQKAVINELKICAGRLIREFPSVEAVYLFGSFATGKATPRSDADLFVVVGDGDRTPLDIIREAAIYCFISAPVPVDVFVSNKKGFDSGRRAGRGVAGAVEKEGVLLALQNSPAVD